MAHLSNDSTEPSFAGYEGKEDEIPEGLQQPLLRRQDARYYLPRPDCNPACGSSSSSSLSPPILDLTASPVRSPPKKKFKGKGRPPSNPAMIQRSRSFCFTLNNYSPAQREALVAFAKTETISYMCFGEEIGSGTPHLQGVVVFARRYTIASAHEFDAFSSSHLEVMKGTIDQAVDYCKKENHTFFEHGEKPKGTSGGGQANKERYELARKSAISGDWDSVPADIFIRSYSSLRNIYKDFAPRPPDSDKPCGFWLYGDPGTGKSRVSRFEHPGYYAKPNNKWFDNYRNEVLPIF